MSKRAMTRGWGDTIILVIAFCFWPVIGFADVFPASSCVGLVDAALVQCQGVFAMSAQLGALQISIDSVAGLAGALSTPLTAISSFWTEELLFFFLGVGLAMVFVRAVGTRW
jgi:hypothetical protein